MKKPRLGIVSTFDDLCGIAGYTRYLMKQLENDFEIEVFDLDQFFMRATNQRVRRAADDMIKAFCAKAKTYDFVNIQFEHGTLGRTKADILRRLRLIVDAAPALSITFHTVPPQEPLDVGGVVHALTRLRIYDAWSTIERHRDHKSMNGSIYALLRNAARHKPVNAIVHTRRDANLMRHINRLPAVFDHPLAFFGADDVARLRAGTSRASFPILENLPEGAKTIGVFGFLSEYKGFETVVRALQFLPDDHHLLLFGGVHPNEIRKQQKIDPYVRKLLDAAYVDQSIFDGLGAEGLTLSTDVETLSKVARHPQYVGHRIHFMGAQSDEDFARAMTLCDHVVLPYLEVGQSASGPMSIALEMGARIIAARNRAFLQFARYHPDTIELFEIGNHLELAERIRARPAHPVETRRIIYDTRTNREIYRAANTR